MSSGSFDDAFIEDADSNNSEILENILEGDDSFLFSNATNKKTSNKDFRSSAQQNTNISSSYSPEPEKFSFLNLPTVTPKSELNSMCQDGCTLKACSVCLNDIQSLPFISSVDLSVAEEELLPHKTMLQGLVGNQTLDGRVEDTCLPDEKLLDCVWGTRKSPSSSVGSVSASPALSLVKKDALVGLDGQRSKERINFRKRKHEDGVSIGSSGNDDSAIDCTSTDKEKKKLLGIFSSNVSRLNQEKVKIAAGGDDISATADDVLSETSLKGFARNLASPNAAERGGCIWEVMTRDALRLTKSPERYLRNDLVETIAAEEMTLFSSLLKSITNDVTSMEECRNDADTAFSNVYEAKVLKNDPQASSAAGSEAFLPEFLLDPATLELGFESSQPSTSKMRRQRRKSISADQEIARQFLDSNVESGLDCAQTLKRCSQRLRRRSTELVPFSERKTINEFVPELRVVCENIKPSSGSDPFPIAEEVPSTEEFTNIVDDTTKTWMDSLDQNSVPMNVTCAVVLDKLLCIPEKPSRKSLRPRRSIELYQATNNTQDSLSLSSMNEASEGDGVNTASSNSQSCETKYSKVSRRKDSPADEPPLEDIYLNKLWRTQMPKESSWETIPEDPKLNKKTGDYKFFTTKKSKCFLNFDQGPSSLQLQLRQQKAKRLGWKPMTKRKASDLNKLLLKKLKELDKEIETLEPTS